MLKAQSTDSTDAPLPTAPPLVDIHCHCLPAIDDGPATMADALELCLTMVQDGIGFAIATPHELGPYERRNFPPEIRDRVRLLNQELQKHSIPLQVLPGAEVRLDGQVIDLLDRDLIMTLVDKRRHLLLELPNEPFIDVTPLISRLSAVGVSVIIAHPERQHCLRRKQAQLRKWSELGAAFQVNAASLVGRGVPGDTDMAWQMLNEGLVDLVASDCHDTRRRPPFMSAARKLVLQRAGYLTANRLFTENPAAVMNAAPIGTRFNAAMAGGRS